MYPSVPFTSYMAPLVVRNTAAAVLTFAYLVGTGGDTGIAYLAERQGQGYEFIRLENGSALLPSMQLDVRSTLETLNRIREVLRFSVSDLAAACQVSRQAVYKWMSGESSYLEPENQKRLEDVYRAAELFALRGASGSVALLKRKNNEGKTLVEAMRAGESAQTWATAMLDTLALESQQRAMLDARLRARKRPPTTVEEWGVPMMSENNA
jgi:transcriptional regulator with XRE-family HTH domain